MPLEMLAAPAARGSGRSRSSRRRSRRGSPAAASRLPREELRQLLRDDLAALAHRQLLHEAEALGSRVSSKCGARCLRSAWPKARAPRLLERGRALAGRHQRHAEALRRGQRHRGARSRSTRASAAAARARVATGACPRSSLPGRAGRGARSGRRRAASRRRPCASCASAGTLNRAAARRRRRRRPRCRERSARRPRRARRRAGARRRRRSRCCRTPPTGAAPNAAR